MGYTRIPLSEYMSFKHYDEVKPSDKYVGFTWRLNDRPYIGQEAKAFRIIGIDYILDRNSLTNGKEITNFHFEEVRYLVEDD